MLGVAEPFSVRLLTVGEAKVSVSKGEDVIGGKLVSMVTLVRFLEGEGLDVKAGPEVVKTTEEFLEKEFLSVKVGIAELFKASALVSVAPGGADESFERRLVKVGVGVGVEVEVEVDVVTTMVVEVLEVLEVGMVDTVHGPFVCLP